MYTTTERRTFSLDRADIRAIVCRLIDTGGRTGEVSMRSPFREDRSPSFSINTDTGLWRDFATGEGGGVLDLYAAVHRMNGRPRAELIGNFVAEFRHFGVEGEDYKDRQNYKPSKARLPYRGRVIAKEKEQSSPPIPYDVTVTTHPGKSPLLAELFALAERHPDARNLVQTLANRVAALGCDRVDKYGAQLFPYRRGGVTVAAKFVRYAGLNRDRNAPGGGIRYEPKGAVTGAIFGDTPKAERVCVIVESEKTALLAGLLMPGFDWVAVGGANRGAKCTDELRQAAAVVVAFDLDDAGAKGEELALNRLQADGVRVSREVTAQLRAKLTLLARDLWPTGDKLEKIDLADVVLQIWAICASPRYRRFAAALSLGGPLCMGDDVKTAQEAGKVASFALWGNDGPRILAMVRAAGLIDEKNGELAAALVDGCDDRAVFEMFLLLFGSIGPYAKYRFGNASGCIAGLQLFGGAVWEAK